MPSERVQRVIDGYLDEIEVAAKDGRWNDVIELANTILELDDTNDDAQTFLKLAVSKSGSQETLSANESVTKNQLIQEVSTDHEKLNLAQESELVAQGSAVYVRRVMNSLLQSSDQEFIDIVAENLKLIEEAPNRSTLGVIFFGSGIPEGTHTRLRFAHLLIPLRKQDMPEGSESPLNNESVLDSLEHWYEDNQADGNFENWGIVPEKSYEGWHFDLSLMTKFVEESYEAFKNPTVPSKKKIEPVTEPTSDYWQTRQELTPLENQDSGTNSSSTSTKPKVVAKSTDDEPNWGWLIVLLLISAVAGYVVFFLVQLIISGILVSGGADTTGPYLISVILSIISGIATGVLVFKRFKS